jgi:hypothetical protein
MEFGQLSQYISQQFGHQLKEADRASVPNLNAFPPSLLEIARKIQSTQHLYAFISFYLPPGHDPYIHPFIFQVIRGQEDPSQWFKAFVLVPGTSLFDQMTKTLEEIFAPFASKIHCIVSPTIPNWMGMNETGSFAFPDPDHNYLTEIPKGFIAHSSDLELEEIDITKIPIYFRRWIAQRIAKCLEVEGQLHYPINHSTMETFAPISQWTPDTHKAIAGLNRELQEGLVNLETTVPGYAGPDEWYA